MMRDLLRSVSDFVDARRRRRRGMPRQGVQLEMPSVFLGSAYGGYAVCLDRVSEQSVVYSFGVGEDVSFDIAIMERFGVTVHAFDPTPRSIAWVEKQHLPERFVMHPWGLAAYDGVARFSPPENPDHISHTVLERSRASGPAIEVPVYKLSTIAARLGHQRIDVLKMDVEGAEYEALDDIVRAEIPVGQILVEFHHQLEGVPLSRTEACIDKLNAAGYRAFWASETGREYAFVKV